ncbi:MAG: hypothetical protein RL711_1594 [Bacteroidota bacterium]|jgi:hypothetical protein
MTINNELNLSKALTLNDLAPLSSRINEIEALFWRLTNVNKQLLEQSLQIAGNPKLVKESYKIAEVVKLTGLSRTTIRSKVVNGEILKLEASSVGMTLIPRSEVERLMNFKNIKAEKADNDQKIFDAIASQQIVGISMSRTKVKKKAMSY